MKYLFRLIGVLIAWPLCLFALIIVTLVGNLFLFLYHLNFKHLFFLDKEDLYFYVERMGHEVSDIDIKNGVCEFDTYSTYYKTPLDMLRGKLTKHVHEKTGNTNR